MNRGTTIGPCAAVIALLCLAVSLPIDSALAQQKQQVSFKVPAENNKFGTQQNIPVGDSPSHIMRVFEVHSTFPSNAPLINGLKLTEIWNRGIADIGDGAGNGSTYFVFVMEGGDKFFVRNANVIQPSPAAGKFVATTVGHIFGGTGKLATIQGIARQVTTFDPVGVLSAIQSSTSSTRWANKLTLVAKNGARDRSSGSFPDIRRTLPMVRFAPKSGPRADIPASP
jgi:hypothetical protein